MSKTGQSLRTPIGRVRGLGAAHRGTEHFITQRITAVALVPLVLWFIWAVAVHTSGDYGTATTFLHNPINAGLMLLLVLTGLYHLSIGLQVVVEDYVGGGARVATLLACKFACAIVAVACVIAIFKLVTV